MADGIDTAMNAMQMLGAHTAQPAAFTNPSRFELGQRDDAVLARGGVSRLRHPRSCHLSVPGRSVRRQRPESGPLHCGFCGPARPLPEGERVTRDSRLEDQRETVLRDRGQVEQAVEPLRLDGYAAAAY